MNNKTLKQERLLPIGIQSFEKLRRENCVYIDKTALVYSLVHTSMPFFLSRPRRFGKSLLLSTLRAYWEGKKQLFEGLAIEKLEQDNPSAWQSYPVFYFDFNSDHFNEETALERMLDEYLTGWEQQYDIKEKASSLNARFKNILQKASEKSGKGCVVLVDEYDKPLLDVMNSQSMTEHNKTIFKGFFSALKSYDEYLRFVFFTGVTKFSKVSIFSDLNHLKDISLSEKYADLCGITEQELRNNLLPEVNRMSCKLGITEEECLNMLRRTYDGYHFHPNSMGVFNPFSLLNALDDMDFGSYWFSTATPTFLIRQLKEHDFDVRKFTNGTLYATEAVLSDYRTDQLNLIPLLYQTGYLTIVDYNQKNRIFTLGFPNEEVKYGFLWELIPSYTPAGDTGNRSDIFTLNRYIEDGDTDGIRDVFTALFAGIPYTTDEAPFEHYFQTVIYLTFTLLGKFCECEMHTWQGRIDCIVFAEKYIYLFEFKRDKTADEALRQIDDMQYALKYAADSRRIFKIGVNFDSGKRILTEWKVKEDSHESRGKKGMSTGQ